MAGPVTLFKALRHGASSASAPALVKQSGGNEASGSGRRSGDCSQPASPDGFVEPPPRGGCSIAYQVRGQQALEVEAAARREAVYNLFVWAKDTLAPMLSKPEPRPTPSLDDLLFQTRYHELRRTDPEAARQLAMEHYTRQLAPAKPAEDKSLERLAQH